MLTRTSSIAVLTAALSLISSPAVSPGERTVDYDGGEINLTGSLKKSFAMPDGFFLTGTVHDSTGAGVVGGVVSAHGDAPFETGAGLTDAAGAFRISVSAGTYRIIARPPVYYGLPDPSWYVRWIAESVSGVTVTADYNMGDIRLEQGYIVSGNLKPAVSGLFAIAGAVVAIPQGGGGAPVVLGDFASGLPDEQTTNPFMFALPKGKYTLAFFGGQIFAKSSNALNYGWVQMPVAAYGATTLSVSKDIKKDISLPKGYKLDGTVADKQKKPLSGVALIIPAGGNPAVDGKALFAPIMNGKLITYLPAGSFSLTILPLMPPTYTGKAAETTTSMTMTTAGLTKAFTANDGAVLSGKVTDAKGAAVNGAQVLLDPASLSPTTTPLSPITVTDASGNYRLTAPAGRYRLRAFPPGLVSASVSSQLMSSMLAPKQR